MRFKKEPWYYLCQDNKIVGFVDSHEFKDDFINKMVIFRNEYIAITNNDHYGTDPNTLYFGDWWVNKGTLKFERKSYDTFYNLADNVKSVKFCIIQLSGKEDDTTYNNIIRNVKIIDYEKQYTENDLEFFEDVKFTQQKPIFSQLK